MLTFMLIQNLNLKLEIKTYPQTSISP